MSPPCNMAFPRLELAFELIEGDNVVMMEYGRAVVYDYDQKFNVNYTLETCRCTDNNLNHNKCCHIWAAQLRQSQIVGLEQ